MSTSVNNSVLMPPSQEYGYQQKQEQYEDPMTQRQILPLHFWTNIMQLEKDLKQESITIEKVQDLITYYRQALEYFDDNGDDAQCEHYRKKMKDLHNYHSVLEALEKQSHEAKKQTPPFNPSRNTNHISASSLPTLGASNFNTQNSDDLVNNHVYGTSCNTFLTQSVNMNSSKPNHSQPNMSSSAMDQCLVQKGKTQKKVFTIKEEEIKQFMEEEESGLNKSTLIIEDELSKQETSFQQRLLARKSKLQKKLPKTPSTGQNPSVFQLNSVERGAESAREQQSYTPGLSAKSESSNTTESDYIEKFIKLLLQNTKNELKEKQQEEIEEVTKQFEEKKVALSKNLKNTSEKMLNKLMDKIDMEKGEKIMEIESKWNQQIKNKVSEYQDKLESTKEELYKNETLSDYSSPLKLKTSSVPRMQQNSIQKQIRMQQQKSLQLGQYSNIEERYEDENSSVQQTPKVGREEKVDLVSGNQSNNNSLLNNSNNNTSNILQQFNM